MLLADYYQCKCPTCGGSTDRIVLSSGENGRIEKAFNKLVRWAFKDKKTSVTPDDLKNKSVAPLIREINEVLQGAIDTGIEYEIPAAMMNHFKNNVFVFSGCKTFEELRRISDLLLDDKKEIKTFSKFFKDTRAIHSEYNELYLESEYLFAKQSANMASRWADYETYGDRFNIQYRTAYDDKVRYAHSLLHDVTLPIDDPFWAEYYPPNGWRCRCRTVQVLKSKYEVSDSTTARDNGAKATYTVGKNGKNTAEMFRFNAAKSNTIFPESHPYFNKDVINAIKKSE